MKTKQEQFKGKLIKLLNDEMQDKCGIELLYIPFAVTDFALEVSKIMNEELTNKDFQNERLD